MSTNWLADRLREPELLLVPGAHDALSAKLVEAHGFEAVYSGGYASVATALGVPDLGIAGLSEMVALHGRVTRASTLPVIVDGDTGHGGLLNVARTVRDMGAIGAVAVQLEDQREPKQCGHLDNKAVVPFDEAVRRIRVAVEVADEQGIAILARTDALQPIGLAAAIERANAFLEVGATAVLVDAPMSFEELSVIGERVQGPVAFNGAETGRGPRPSVRDLAALGFAMVFFPIELMSAGCSAMSSVLAHLREHAEVPSVAEVPRSNFDDMNGLLGMPEMVAWERKWAERLDVKQ